MWDVIYDEWDGNWHVVPAETYWGFHFDTPTEAMEEAARLNERR